MNMRQMPQAAQIILCCPAEYNLILVSLTCKSYFSGVSEQ